MVKMSKAERLNEIIEGCPIDEIIGDNLIRAYSKINSPKYKKIICTISGGYDSDITMDICIRCDIENKITYVFFDTGLEYKATKEHLKELERKYNVKIAIKKARKPIPKAVKEYGVPFLSKTISEFIERLQRHGFKWEDKPFEELYKEYPKCKAALRWWCNEWDAGSRFNISRNKWLKEYMIDNPPEMAISPKCCEYAKKAVLHGEISENGYDLDITGMRKSEGGARSTRYQSCFKENESGADLYMPIWWYSEKTKEKYKKHYKIKQSECYTKYGLKRTGCAGCPFGKGFESELKIMEQYEPKLFKAANFIFDKSYRYTRNYRSYMAFMEGEK